MKRLVPLASILDNTDYQSQNGDYIQVNTVWTSGKIKTLHKKPICKYIFADSEGRYIGAVLFCFDRANTIKVHKKLQTQTCWFHITKFKVDNIAREEWCEIRGQTRQIKINNSSLYVKECELPLPMCKHLPFEFTNLGNIDTCQNDDVVDVIGFAVELSKESKSALNNNLYKTVTLSSTASKTDTNQILRKVAVFGNCLKQVTRKNVVYAMMNLKVGEFGPDNVRNKTLQTTERTKIWKVSENEMDKLPPEHTSSLLTLQLFPPKRSRASTTQSRNPRNATILPVVS